MLDFLIVAARARYSERLEIYWSPAVVAMALPRHAATVCPTATPRQ